LCLLQADHAKGPWRQRPLPERVSRAFRNGFFCLASSGSVVALADKEQGAFLSTDGGHEFRQVPGTAGTTALAVAESQGTQCVWASVAREVAGQTDVLRIDPDAGSALRVARLDTRDPEDETFAPVVSLYPAPDGRLYATGSFGMLCLSPTTESGPDGRR
jgi:hypothetical protein